jgi:lipopolysaccharide transport system ATP-binding protein
MSSEIAISLVDISKCYAIYERPRDRLLQMLSMGTRRYAKDYWALRDVSFEVKKGESVGILGRNGSGKSTLLQIITGTLAPTTGDVRTHGRIAALLELGSGFNPDFTGRENIYLNGSLLGFERKRIDELFDDIAAFADVGDYLDQPVKTYSSGMLLRVAFAVQVQVQPDILIIDEALAVGDALFQKRCFQRIERLLNDGVTVLFVSHDQESVRTLTSRAILLKKGVVVAQGISSEVVLGYRRLLHEDESAYFSDVAKRIADKTAQPRIKEDSPIERGASRSDQLTFGDGEARILTVETFDEMGESATVFYPGDLVRIKVTCESDITSDHLNVAIRIRNKEGVKIYSWGTLNQDIAICNRNGEQPVFWKRVINAGEIFCVELQMQCSLGVNLYEIQASISYEDTPDYMSQRILHWMDEAAFFQVLIKREEYFFGGVVDLKMQASW